ncbi:U6 snRNA-associated Sm-like protein LSm8 [Chytriomyces sp. MP71]|nr:U6 snRNA-associated Sm-like protein LSm8 [Chytriomyces sp. MP71]
MAEQAGLHHFVNHQVFVVTYEGRTIMGELKGFDQTCTLILKKAVERIIHKNDITEEIPLGLYIIRGPDVAIVGELDADRDDAIDWEQVHAPTMRSMQNE